MPRFKCIVQEVLEWLIEDEHVKNEMNDNEIIAEVMKKCGWHWRRDYSSCREEALEMALPYVNQKSTSTAIDVLNLKKWRD